MKKRFLLAAVLWCFGAITAAAQEFTENAGRRAFKEFGRDLYILAERTGGSPSEWDKAEQDLIGKLVRLQNQNALDLRAFGEDELTLLGAASKSGYAFALDWLLRNTKAIETVDIPDINGITPYQYAALSQRQTLRACHPVIENPFVVVPYLVVLPYFTNRDPYSKILEMLENAGADTDLSALRQFWLETCSNPDQDLRDKIAQTTEFRETLIMAAREIDRQACRNEMKESMAVLEEAFGGDQMSAKRRKELDAAIAFKMAECDR